MGSGMILKEVGMRAQAVVNGREGDDIVMDN